MLLVLVVNAAGVNVFGVLAVDFSTVVVVNNEDSSLPLKMASLDPEVTNSTMGLTVATSSSPSSVSVATTAKTFTSLEKKRSDFCLQFPQYEALCKGCYISHTHIRPNKVLKSFWSSCLVNFLSSENT